MTLDEFVRQFATALLHNSKMRFDNIGIDTLGYSLPSRKAVDDAWDRYMGVGQFGQWWMEKVYPRLFPTKYKTRIDCYLEASRAHDNALIVYYLEQAAEIAKGLECG